MTRIDLEVAFKLDLIIMPH